MHRQAHVTLVNGDETSAISISDRGLAYGDGIFETMRVVKSKIPLFEHHLARFKLGLSRLHFDSPKALVADFKRYTTQALSAFSGDALVKVILTRGSGGRGYTPPDSSRPNFIVQVFDLPRFDAADSSNGVAVKVVEHRLPLQPALAGIKHLNRLDQVLASYELDHEYEGLIRDPNGNVVEGTKSNLLVFEGGEVVTPSIESCGVKGVLRDFLISNSARLGFKVRETEISVAQLMDAKGVALVNSVFGCYPITKIDSKAFSIDPRCGTIQQLLEKELGYSY